MAHGGDTLRFVQISDTHIGFNKPANTDVTATLRAAIGKIKAEPELPAFVLHTGDLTHLSKAAEFDTLQQILSELPVPVLCVPGEHDVLEDDGKGYLQRFGKGTRGAGWKHRAGRLHRRDDTCGAGSLSLFDSSRDGREGRAVSGDDPCCIRRSTARRKARRARDSPDITVPIGLPSTPASS